MPNYFGQQLYGDYNPYSQTNLQGGVGGLMGQQTPFEEILRRGGGGDGNTQLGGTAKASTERFGLGPDQGRLAEARAFSGLTPGAGLNLAKDVGLGTFNPGSYLGAIPDAAMSAAGVERPEGFGGWALSKLPAVAGTLALGPVGGLLGGIAGTPFADILSDAMDTRPNEPMHEDFEGTFGQLGGRRGYADVRQSLNEPTAMSNLNVEDAMNMMRQHAQVGSPDLQEQNQRDYETLQNVMNRMSEVRGLMPDVEQMRLQQEAKKFADDRARSQGRVNIGFNPSGNISWGGSTGYQSRDSGGNSGGGGGGGGYNSGAGGQTGGDKDGGRY